MGIGEQDLLPELIRGCCANRDTSAKVATAPFETNNATYNNVRHENRNVDHQVNSLLELYRLSVKRGHLNQ